MRRRVLTKAAWGSGELSIGFWKLVELNFPPDLAQVRLNVVCRNEAGAWGAT